MEQIDLLPSQEFGQSQSTTPIHTPSPAEYFDFMAFRAQFVADRSRLIETDEYEITLGLQLPGQSRRQDFRAANVERVQNLANNGRPLFLPQREGAPGSHARS